MERIPNLQGPSGYDFEPRMTEEDFVALATARFEDTQRTSLSDSNGPNTEPTTSNRRENTNWCMCTKCVKMVSDVECLCCLEIWNLEEKVQNSCVTLHEDFRSVCLTKAVLETTWAFVQYTKGNIPSRDLQNRQYRFIAYKLFTLWAHGKLGKGRRTPIPSCVVDKIRSMFPEDDDEYTGFAYAEEVYATSVP